MSGDINVTIQEIGSIGANFQNKPLAGYAGNVYVALAGKRIKNLESFFQLVSFDPATRELVVRLAN